jgi:FkbM family methyltransferase
VFKVSDTVRDMRSFTVENTVTEHINLDRDFDLVDAKAGRLYVIRNDSTVSKNIREIGHWAWEHIEIFKSLSKVEGTFVDVGAFIGHHSVAMLNWKSGSGHVIAIEGQPQIAELCASNLNLQRYSNWRVVESMADSVSRIYEIPIEDFDIPNNFGSLSLISPQVEFGNNFFQVTSNSLDQILDLNTEIDLMKFDIQYAELFALRGASRILQQQRPNLFIEISPHFMKTKGNYDYRSVYNFLTGFGYQLFDLLGKPIGFERSATPLFYEPDLEWDVIGVHESNLKTLKSVPWLF